MTTDISRAVSLRFIKSYKLLYALDKVANKRDFCQKTALYPQNFSIIERGALNCTIDNIYHLAASFNVSLDWMFFENGDFIKQ